MWWVLMVFGVAAVLFNRPFARSAMKFHKVDEAKEGRYRLLYVVGGLVFVIISTWALLNGVAAAP